jgi:hypothetical protein
VTRTVTVLEDRWRLLESTGSPTSRDGVKTAAVGLEIAGAEVAAAIDADGLHHLLVPLRADQRVRRSNEDGSALSVRERSLDDGVVRWRYLSIGCLKAELNDAFTSVCADVVEAVRNAPEHQVKASLAAIDRWRELLKVNRPRLTTVQLAGLFGELMLLTRLLTADSSAAVFWTGPTGHRHDFSAGVNAIEVKTSTTGDATRVRIHGLDQLDAPPGGGLDLMWLHVEQSATGASVPELIAEALLLADDAALFRSGLEALGYRLSEAAAYGEARFTVLDERWYAVADSFPRLTVSQLEEAGLGLQVSDVHYTVDLAAATAYRLDAAAVAAHITRFMEEAA